MGTEKKVEPALLHITIQANSCYCGLPLSTIKIPDRCSLLGLLRQENIIPISENPVIATGDIILAITLHSMLAPALTVSIAKSHPVYYSLNHCLLSAHALQRFCRLS